MLPAASVTVFELSVSAFVLTLPLFVIESVASSVSVLLLVVFERLTPVLIVRLPDTATVTFALSSANEIALAISASSTKSLGSNIHRPA